MRLLLDTHIFLWAIDGSKRLSRQGWEFLEDESIPLSISAASIWEIAIKHARGAKHLDAMPLSGAAALIQAQNANFDLLAISPAHAAAVDGLPFHHRDPFDRLLVAQARSESMQLLTHDRTLGVYGDFVIVV